MLVGVRAGRQELDTEMPPCDPNDTPFLRNDFAGCLIRLSITFKSDNIACSDLRDHAIEFNAGAAATVVVDDAHLPGTVVEHKPNDEWRGLRCRACVLSSFIHGEQGLITRRTLVTISSIGFRN